MIRLGKAGKTSGSSSLRWIFGFIFVVIIIAGINAGIKDDQVAEEPEQAAQQTGETDLAEAQVQADSPAAGENPADENLTVHFLDVGQGDSILLKYNGKTMLVDAGERDQGSEVSAYLYEQDVSGIDYVIATHPHSDHIGGMEDVLNGFQVEHFIDSGFPHTSKTYENMLTTIDEKKYSF